MTIEVDRDAAVRLSLRTMKLMKPILMRGDVDSNFTVMNALAICAATVLATVPPHAAPRVRAWFDNAVTENIADMKGRVDG